MPANVLFFPPPALIIYLHSKGEPPRADKYPPDALPAVVYITHKEPHTYMFVTEHANDSSDHLPLSDRT